VSWIFPVSRAIGFGLTRSRCVHESPTVSSCARTYSGQRPGPTSGPANRLSPGCASHLGEHRRRCQPPGKIIGGARSGPRIGHRIRRLVRRLPAGTGSRGHQHPPRLSPPRGALRQSDPGGPRRVRTQPRRDRSPCGPDGTCRRPSVDLACTWATGRRCWREVKYERHQRIHASDRRCREPARRPVIGRRSTQRGRWPGERKNRRRGGVDVGGAIAPIPPYCSICSSAEIDL
jgi:hypothetical protein